VALMSRLGYTRERFAVIHPGGAVGRRLRARAGA
jgi:D-arabinose 5-phosphate isomerase GutQ